MKRKLFQMLVLFFAFAMHSSAQEKEKWTQFPDSLQVTIYSKGILIRLHPNPATNGKANISTYSTDDLHFYVFDCEGTLMYQTTLKGNSRHILPAFKQGSYMYDVFKNDQSIEDGKIMVQ